MCYFLSQSHKSRFQEFRFKGEKQMSLKKTLLLMSLFLTSLIVIIPTSIGTPSPTTVSLEPQSVLDTSLVPGTQFTIDMSLDYVEPDLLWGYQLTLSFNPAVLHGVSVENGPFLESRGGSTLIMPGPGFNNTGGTLGLFAAYLYPIEKFPEGGSDEHGPLCTITFEVVEYGGSPITMGPETGLANSTETHAYWIIHKKENPEFFFDSYFDNRPPISVDPKTVKDVPVGGSFNVSVNVADMADLYSWEFYMNWSVPMLDVTSVVEGDFLKSQPGETQFDYEIHNDEGYIYVSCARTVTPGVTGDGTLAQISFLVKSIGNSTIHLYDTLLLDSAQKQMLSTTIDGFFDNLKIHDIAVTSVTAFPSMIEPGIEDHVHINVTVENKGDFTETFNVTIYYGEKEIDEETDISLDPGANIILTFTWNITGVEGGAYSIKAEASVVTDEANTENNTHIYKSVIIIHHNISIIKGSTTSTKVESGDSVHIDITIKNKGSVTETFNVTTYYNETAIETETISDLRHGESRTFTVIWNITDVEPGLYLIMSETSDIPDDADTSDNVRPIAVIEVMEASEESLYSKIIIPVAAIAVILGVSAVYIIFRRIRRSPEEAW